MNESQIIGVGMTVLAVLGGTLFSSFRISGIDTSVNSRIDEARDVLRREMRVCFSSMYAALCTRRARRLSQQ